VHVHVCAHALIAGAARVRVQELVAQLWSFEFHRQEVVKFHRREVMQFYRQKVIKFQRQENSINFQEGWQG